MININIFGSIENLTKSSESLKCVNYYLTAEERKLKTTFEVIIILVEQSEKGVFRHGFSLFR